MSHRKLNFNLLARPYRWLEYLTFGKSLELCRFHYLPALTEARSALVFGDGDGRFLARLLKSNPELAADIVDVSPAMLRVLSERLTPDERKRVTLHCADARQFTVPARAYDLVVTHFFLDCLYEPEIACLIDHIQSHIQPDALWVISEFSVPSSGACSWIGQAFISSLYWAFWILTGLPPRKLPDHAAKFKEAGLILKNRHESLGGLLVSELWQFSVAKNPVYWRVPL